MNFDEDINDNNSKTPLVVKTVYEKILEWSEGCSIWQKDALRRIFQKKKIEDQDITELASFLKAEKSEKLQEGLARPLSKDDLPANPKVAESVNIIKLSNIVHVNNLAVNQELVFNDRGITVIYGGNGSGKSGYTRILKSACRARHRARILTNIFAPEFKDETPTADVDYSTESGSNETVTWQDSDRPHKVLSAVSVFDRECAAIHIHKKGNEIAFRPYGLDIPDALADVFRRIETSLASEISMLKSSRNTIFSNPPWQSTTTAGKFSNSITKNTTKEDLDNICNFTEQDEERLKFLINILSKDIQKAAYEEDLKAKYLLNFKDKLNAIAEKLSLDKLDNLLIQKQRTEDARQAAELAASSILNEDVLPNIGSQVWKRMWIAAKEYSLNFAYPEKIFPNTEDGAKCVLCQQVLENNSKKRMQAFEKHVSGDLEKKAREEKEIYDKLYCESIFGYIRFSDYQNFIKDIELNAPSLLKIIRRYLASIRLRQMQFKQVINKAQSGKISEYAPSPIQEIEHLIEKHTIKAKELENSANEEGITKLKAEKHELEARKIVKEHKLAILNEIKLLRDIAFLEDCIKETNTRKITMLGNNIADDVITPKIKDRFQEEIIELVGNRVRVELQRSGGSFGSPYYKLSLLSSPGTDLSTVLSEGEQTCVAIAIFLAELATSPHKSALVFDDPVSSLDHDWRWKVASRLVEEAKLRQVIVFTHDLVFLNDIEDSAENKGVNFLSQHLTRTPKTVGVVNDNLPWVGMSTETRIDTLEKEARKLRNERDNLTQEEYNSKAGTFYDNMRAAWERALEEVGLSHVIMRHRDYINAKNLNKISALDLAACQAWYQGWSRCCDYINSHDPARGRNQALPEPQKLLDATAELATWVKSIRNTQKQIKNNS
ncbi:MAG: AAA family ATPase [Gammaproteobacteria bacterium]|nr:AAA family ATPase [Gammaproteobacteria bacterium]